MSFFQIISFSVMYYWNSNEISNYASQNRYVSDSAVKHKPVCCFWNFMKIHWKNFVRGWWEEEEERERERWQTYRQKNILKRKYFVAWHIKLLNSVENCFNTAVKKKSWTTRTVSTLFEIQKVHPQHAISKTPIVRIRTHI